MILSALESGAQGPNQTADATLFRAPIFHSYAVSPAIRLTTCHHSQFRRRAIPVIGCAPISEGSGARLR